MTSGVPRHRKDQSIILRRISYGPMGFTCSCGGKNFKPEKKLLMMSGGPRYRHSHRCEKCQMSYIFVSRTFSKETK